jgi:hypothetical protein
MYRKFKIKKRQKGKLYGKYEGQCKLGKIKRMSKKCGFATLPVQKGASTRFQTSWETNGNDRYWQKIAFFVGNFLKTASTHLISTKNSTFFDIPILIFVMKNYWGYNSTLCKL